MIPNDSGKKKLTEIIHFGLAGVAGFISDYLTTLIFSLFVSPYIARLPAFISATITTWLLNRTYTFKDKSHYASALKEYVHYTSLMLVGLLVNYSVYAVVYAFLSSSNGRLILSVAAGSLSGMAINYLLSKKYIYRKSS